ncbi:MAG TPA: hypothetical protein VFA75_12535 [Nevskia sp.]|nr:hypothetical protein [Nevskia sp.]
MAAQLARMLRASMLREVAGCAVDHAAHGAEAVLAQRAVGRLAEAQHQVQARRLGIDQLVAEQQFHLERRIARHERGQRRHQVAHPELVRRADAQAAVDLHRRNPGLAAREVEVGQHGADARVEALPGGGGTAAARGAGDELHAQLLLQVRQQAAHRLQRAAKTPRRGGEAAAFDHRDVGGVGIE